MTEHEWLTGADPQAMLSALHLWENHKPTDRKLRLFAVACCRAAGYEGRERALALAERFADGELDRIPNPARHQWIACMDDTTRAAKLSAGTSYPGEPSHKANLLRCIFGNPYHPVTPLPQEILRWNGNMPQALAEEIYEAQTFCDMPILADALEEAECPKEVVCPECKDEIVPACYTCESCRRILDLKHYTRMRCYHCGSNRIRKSRRSETCDYCGRTGRIPNPILAHLRQTERVCPECGGTKKVKIENNPPYRERWIRCDVYHREVGRAHLGCDGTGRLPAVHARGCWVLDLILGKEGCL